MLVVGREHNYTRSGGIVVGRHHTVSGDYAAVSGGRGHTASGDSSSISGGGSNTAHGNTSSMGGGANRSVDGEVPVVFAKLLEAHGTLGPAEVPAKSGWMWNNLRKAALLGVPLESPAFHPFNPLLSWRASSLPLGEMDPGRTRRCAVQGRMGRATTRE